MEGVRVPDRFRVVRRLGAGGMGVVYEAEDRERGERVALKTLDRPSPEQVYQLKNEFRGLAGIRHRNLVTLHELIASERSCIFTMEFVDGVDLRDYVRAEGGYDESRLRDVLGQLATGLAALHLLGRVHRDIKPANVMVTPEQRVVLVDFGLAVSTAGAQGLAGQPLVGTVEYVAPEQGVGAEPSPSADWYSVGVMLYEILTGRLPFSGRPLEILVAKQKAAPASPSAFSPTPPDLDQLCIDLMAPHPSDRPRDAEILRRLGIDPEDERLQPETTDYSLSPSVPFTGRDQELSRLVELADQPRPTATLVLGPSGIGKSALVGAVVAQLRERRPETLCFRGRCFQRETVPYKALDGVIDELSRYWRELPPAQAEALVPAGAESLRRMFPVLGRVPALLRGALENRAAAPRDLRILGLGALRDVFRALSREHLVVLYLDDMQWVDGDTLLLLDDLFRSSVPLPVSLLLTARSDADVLSDLVARLERRELEVDSIELQPLGTTAARALAAAHLGQGDDGLLERIATEAQGNPFYIGELARHARSPGAGELSLVDSLAARVEALKSTARRVLDLLVIAAEPVSLGVLRSATGVASSRLPRVVRELAEAHLVRGAGVRETDRIEAYHDRVRETALALIPAPRRTRYHRQLAIALEDCSEGGAERLARHWLEAGKPGRAALHARLAADQAMATLDTDRAVALFTMAIELGDASTEERFVLRMSLGESLSAAGRTREAAKVFLAALEDAPLQRHSQLRRRSAEELMRGGYLREGLAAIEPVLQEHGIRLPTSVSGALSSLLARRALARLRGLRWRPRPVSVRELERVDLLRALATGMNLSDLVRGAECQSRHLASALSCNDPLRVTRALAYETAHLAASGSRRARVAVKVAKQIAAEQDDGLIQAFTLWSEAVVCYYLDNQWSRALELLTQAKVLFLEYTNAGWELDITHVFTNFCHLYRGDLPDLSREVPRLIQQAERRGDRYEVVYMRTRMHMVWLAADRSDLAEREVAQAIERDMPATERYMVPHFFALFSRSELALYRGQPDVAERAISAELERLRKSLILRIRMCRLEFVHLQGRVALALAARAPMSERGPQLRSVARHIKWLAGCREPVAQQLGSLLRAGAGTVEGHADADGQLADAIASLDAGGTGLYAAAARVHSGDAAVRDAGLAWMRASGIVAPVALARMLAPGFA